MWLFFPSNTNILFLYVRNEAIRMFAPPLCSFLFNVFWPLTSQWTRPKFSWGQFWWESSRMPELVPNGAGWGCWDKVIWASTHVVSPSRDTMWKLYDVSSVWITWVDFFGCLAAIKVEASVRETSQGTFEYLLSLLP